MVNRYHQSFQILYSLYHLPLYIINFYLLNYCYLLVLNLMLDFMRNLNLAILLFYRFHRSLLSFMIHRNDLLFDIISNTRLA